MFYLSYAVLWCICLLLCVAVIRLYRKAKDKVQSELLEQDHGMSLGERFPPNGININNRSYKGTIVIFTTVGCSACKLIYRTFNKFSKKHNDFNFIFIALGDKETVSKNFEENNISAPFISITHEMMEFYQTRIFPFAYLLNSEFRIIRKGVINDEHHLNLLLKNIRSHELEAV